MENKKHLIIGGAGFIGSNLASKLLKRGESVTIFDNFSIFVSLMFKTIEFIQV